MKPLFEKFGVMRSRWQDGRFVVIEFSNTYNKGGYNQRMSKLEDIRMFIQSAIQEKLDREREK